MLETRNSHSFGFSVFDLYVGISFFVQFLLWMGLFFVQPNFWDTNVFLTISLVGHYVLFVRGVGFSQYIMQSKWHPWLYIFQATTLIGCAALWNNTGTYYMAMIPLMASVYFFKEKELPHPWTRFLYYTGPFIFALLTGLFAVSNYSFSAIDAMIMATFCLWMGAFISWANTFVLKEQKSFIYALLKKNKEKNLSQDKRMQKERFFYHDIINHAHGISLFLQSKINSHSDVSFEEADGILHEIKMLQSLIKDHFGYKHKNLRNSYEYVTLDFAKEGIQRLIHNYLPPSFVDTHIIYQGMASASASPWQRSQCSVHYPSLFRILGNVVKNIAEAKSTQAEFIFNYTPEGLQVFIRNRIYRLQDDQQNLAENLSEIILFDEQKNESDHIGLESIAQICEDLGGEFHFWHEGEFWVNQIFLPAIADTKQNAA